MHRETEENMSTKGTHNSQSRKRKRSDKNSSESNDSNNGSIESYERPTQACPSSTSCSGSFGSDQFAVNPAPNELRLVLLGKTGAGKSTTGNTILGNKRFDDGLSMSSVTECRRVSATVEERELVLVDTPGFFDTNLTDEELQEEVIRCLALCSPGPHAFLLVIPIQSIKEQQRTIDTILEMFHEDATHHTILIFSHADRLQGESIEGFVSKQNQKVQKLVERFGSRFIAFDNTNPTNRDQVRRLLQEVDELLAMNYNCHFTSEITEAMQKAQKILEEKLAERVKKINKEVKKLADHRWHEFIACMNEVSEETDRKRKRIQRRIDLIEKDIEKEKQNVRLIQARLNRFRASLHTEKNNLRRLLIREDEERRQREEREKKDLDIWKKDEEKRRLREEEKNNELFSSDKMKWLIMLSKFLMNLGARYAPLLLKHLFPEAPAVNVRSPAENLAGLLGYGPAESPLFATLAENAVNYASVQFSKLTGCCIQ